MLHSVSRFYHTVAESDLPSSPTKDALINV